MHSGFKMVIRSRNKVITGSSKKEILIPAACLFVIEFILNCFGIRDDLSDSDAKLREKKRKPHDYSGLPITCGIRISISRKNNHSAESNYYFSVIREWMYSFIWYLNFNIILFTIVISSSLRFFAIFSRRTSLYLLASTSLNT